MWSNQMCLLDLILLHLRTASRIAFLQLLTVAIGVGLGSKFELFHFFLKLLHFTFGSGQQVRVILHNKLMKSLTAMIAETWNMVSFSIAGWHDAL